MMKRNDFIALLILTIPFLYWYLIYDTLQDKIPVHWNIQGEADDWETRDSIPSFFAITSAVALVVYFIIRSLNVIDPKRSAKVSQKVFNKVALNIVIFITSLNILTLYSASHSSNPTSLIFFIVSIFFAFLGNLMYNIKPNYFVGLRLPWTLEDEENWKQTHRLAGILWFSGGLIAAVITLAFPSSVIQYLIFPLIIILVIIPSGYSFYLFKKSKSDSNEKKV